MYINYIGITAPYLASFVYMDLTTARSAAFTVLFVSSLVTLSSENELIDRTRSGSAYGLSGCLVDCDAGLLDCSLRCFSETPLKCLADCFLSRGGAAMDDPSSCTEQCVDSVLDCLQDCSNSDDDDSSPSPHPRVALGPLPPFPSPVHRAAPPAWPRRLLLPPATIGVTWTQTDGWWWLEECLTIYGEDYIYRTSNSGSL